eukprot:6697830-Alexandrium_andersonii.AAC.1
MGPAYLQAYGCAHQCTSGRSLLQDAAEGPCCEKGVLLARASWQCRSIVKSVCAVRVVLVVHVLCPIGADRSIPFCL